MCGKGRGLPAWHHGPGRLDHPRLGDRAVPWDELLADLAGHLGPIIVDDPHAVALYLATGLANDAAGQVAAAQWLPSIGSASFVTAVTVDNAPVLVAGAGAEVPVVRVHPDDLTGDADSVTLTSAYGSVTATAVADPLVRRGVASMTHGHADAGPGALTSGGVDVDPLTAMPLAAGLPVMLSPRSQAT